MSFSYQWSDGTTGQTDKLSTGDLGKSITVTVTASNDGGSAMATSAPAGPVAAAPPPATSAPQNTAAPSISGTPQSGDTLTANPGTWTSDGSSVTFAYAWSDGRTGRTDALTAADVGQRITVTVTATNDGGSSQQVSAPVGPVAAAPSAPAGSSAVGFAAAPTPACSTTVAVNGNVTSALANAATGSTVCLASGSWSEITLGSSLTKTVTLAAATPGAVTVAGLQTEATIDNLTVEGINFTNSVLVTDNASNDTFKYNTLENWGNSGEGQLNSAFLIYPGDHGTPGAASGIQMLYNQIDHVPQCLQDDSGGGNTFSHNVCGPFIGNGGESDVHYTQTDGLNNETIDNNAFEGPLAPGAQGHINVTHLAGSNDEFDNNILWHVQGNQHLQWNDDAASTNLEANNNLDVEDPSEGVGAYEQIANNFSLNGFTQDNNTVIGAKGETASDIFVEGSPTGCSVSDNIGVTNPTNGSFGLARSCTASNNVSDDGTATGTGSIPNWTPVWQSTSWTPNDGSPWNPPPANYYKPSGLASTFGYQGTIGP
jgi:hypothetical protein